MTSTLTDDHVFQAGFVAENAWRLLSLQDANPLSPSYGCFHYAYWRDKTSEFPDGRFQEAGAALGLLALPAFDGWREAGTLASPEMLMVAFSAALSNWEAQQYPDGCWDEWYKGERGFAVTEFTMIAYGLAARFLGERIGPNDRARLHRVMARAGYWLAGRHDRVKANHEAAAAAALALAWEVTGDAGLKIAARAAVENTLGRQRPEGWFPEIGGMDLGYCSVLLDYLMLYTTVTDDEVAVAPMRRLFAFMLPHLQPDYTISAEAGLCLNPYVSRLGIGLLSAWDEDAAAMVAGLKTVSPRIAGLTPTLADDLRFCRWSHLPLATLLFVDRMRPAIEQPGLEPRYPNGWTRRAEANVMACHQGELHVFFAPAGGGVVRVYQGCRLLCEDIGLSLTVAGGSWGSVGYDSERPVSAREGGWEMASALRPAAFFFPSFLSRLVLRLGCHFTWSAALMRKMIDAYRLKARTAINQSAAPVAKGEETYPFRRAVTVAGGIVTITDVLESRGAPIPLSGVCLELRAAMTPQLPGGSCRRLTVVKQITPAGVTLTCETT